MSAWHGIYADLLRQRFSALVAYGVVLTGERVAGLDLAQRAMETVFSRARAPQGVPQAESAVRREMVRLVVADAGASSGSRPDAGAGLASGPDAGAGLASGPDAAAGLGADRAEPRGSLASLSPPERAAAVLFAVDGLDDHAIRRELRRGVRDRYGRRGGPHGTSTPAALSHADANEIRAVYAAEAARPASPAGGATAAIATSRSARREALVRRGVLTGSAAVAVIALGFGAAQAIDVTDFSADPSPSPTPQVLTVAWNPGQDLDAAVAGLSLPACGDIWLPGPQSVHGITPTVTVEEDLRYDDRRAWIVRQAYDYGDTPPVPLLYVPGLVVVTLDDRVVRTTDLAANPPVAEGVEYASPVRRGNVGEVPLNRMTLCDAQAAWDEAGFNDVDWDALAQDERSALIAERRAFRERWSHMEPGTYRVYSVAPMMFGEQAALAPQITRMGVPSLSNLRWYLAGSQISNDPRISPYCSQRQHDDDFDEPECDPPASLLKEVLTREVDLTTINDWEPGVGISEPVVVVIE